MTTEYIARSIQMGDVREFGFELRLCAHLESRREGFIARQLGGGVEHPGSRVVDTVHVAPGPEFDRRRQIGGTTIPQAALEADVGIGTWRRVTAAIDAPPERAREIAEQAAQAGFFERERRSGHTAIRRATDYPTNWFGSLTAIENKPTLDSPGALDEQLRFDTALGLFDRVVLATGDHVTRAHLNRLPDAVGVWEFDPDSGERTVVVEPTELGEATAGTEIRAEEPLRTAVTPVSGAQMAVARRRIAERAWGKGWRTYELPSCTNCEPDRAGIPWCTYYDRIVSPDRECGPDCPGYDPDESAALDLDTLRAARTPWDRNPPGVTSEQARLDQF